MRTQVMYALIAGVATGAAPFLLLGFRTTGLVPAAAAILLATVLCGSASRSPLALALGVLVGTTAAVSGLALYAGTDWRLLLYVPVGFPVYYAAGAAGVFGRRWYVARHVPAG